jgi:RIO-like serine/threonine protein kinase
VIVRGRYLLTICEMIIGRKTRMAISFKISNLLIVRELRSTSQNSKGTVKGASSWLTITRLMEREIFPLTISVSTGVETPAGIAVSRSIPVASSVSKILVEKKKARGMTSI